MSEKTCLEDCARSHWKAIAAWLTIWTGLTVTTTLLIEQRSHENLNPRPVPVVVDTVAAIGSSETRAVRERRVSDRSVVARRSVRSDSRSSRTTVRESATSSTDAAADSVRDATGSARYRTIRTTWTEIGRSVGSVCCYGGSYRRLDEGVRAEGR